MQPMSTKPSSTKPSRAQKPAAKRSYDSSRRKRQAAQTRSEVLSAAMTLFNDSGWAGTTIAAIAEAAGVAVETIYSGFGSKKALLRAAADAGIVGDAEPVAYIDRPEFDQLGLGTMRERMGAGTALLANTHQRSAGVWRAVQDAAENDEELAAWALEAGERRRLDTGRSLERMLERTLDGPMLDVLWVLYGPETYRKLVHERGYTRAEYQACIAEATVRMLGEDLALLDG